ncbi:ATP-binding cassette domain-containing protein [Thalassotalea ganghwensis]
MSNVLAVNNLTKSFKDKPILKQVSFNVPEQSIYAFLGNNGAGKSTTIKILMGLLKRDSGTFKIFNNVVASNAVDYRKDIGCIIDSPAQYGELTGGENLTIHCHLKNIPTSDIDRVLAIVDLQGAKHHKVSEYSLGMKQRLALAAALLGAPKLLILDEPTNGLDPKGMVEARQLIKSIPEVTGATVFISSHLLDEVEKMASHVAILNQGTITLESSIGCLNSDQGELALFVNHSADVYQLVSQLGYQANQEQDVVKVSKLTWEQCAHINQEVIRNGYQLFNAQYKKTSLEQYFHQHVLS